MIAQIDEQQMAVVALAMNPSRQADGLANVLGAQLGAGMGAVGVHLIVCSLFLVIPSQAGIPLNFSSLGKAGPLGFRGGDELGDSPAALHWREPFCQAAR